MAPSAPVARAASASAQQWTDVVGILDRLDVDHVIDVGANMGQYARALRSFGYQGRISSFEPVLGAFEVAYAQAADDPTWSVRQCAIGAARSTATINIAANNAQSSSILPMLGRHEEAAPHATYVGSQEIDVIPLDEAMNALDPDAHAFLKIDTQGFELEVIAGSRQLLAGPVRGIQIELSMVPLYAGGPLYEQVFEVLHDARFRLTHVIPGYVDPATGEMLQFDGVFIRQEKGPFVGQGG